MVKEIILALSSLSLSIMHLDAQNFTGPDTVSVQSGKLILKGLLWHPVGTGKFPAIIFCHGSYGGSDTIHDPLLETSLLGPVFAARGYVFFVLFRRGTGLSHEQGVSSAVLIDAAFKKGGQKARNALQLQQLETDQLDDMISGIRFLRKRKDVDKDRIAITGHSFGGSLALLVAEHYPNLKAVVIFSPGGFSWDHSFQLRTRLITAVKNISAPVMFIHAQNDYSINPGYALDSVMNQLKKPHVLKIYPKFGNSANEGHNLIFGNIDIWKESVFKFLDLILIH
jgi:dienelactone hydrolase